MAAGQAQICNKNTGLKVFLVIQIPFQLFAFIVHGSIMRFQLRKGLRPGVYVSTMAWVYDLILFIFTMMTWFFMTQQNCDMPLGATVMFYSNLLSTLLLIQSIQIYNII